MDVMIRKSSLVKLEQKLKITFFFFAIVSTVLTLHMSEGRKPRGVVSALPVPFLLLTRFSPRLSEESLNLIFKIPCLVIR